MARLFDDANTEYLKVLSAAAVGTPLTMACWFYADSIARRNALMCLSDESTDDIFSLSVDGDSAGDPIVARVYKTAVGGAAAKTAVGYSAGVWGHACGTFESNVLRNAFFGGGNKATNVDNLTPTGIDSMLIGSAWRAAAPLWLMSGRIAEASVWIVILADEEIAALGRGVSPRRIRPESQIPYWPLWGLHSPEIDCGTGDYPMTLYSDDSGPVLANHAPVEPFLARLWPVVVLAPEAEVVVPRLADYYRRRRVT